MAAARDQAARIVRTEQDDAPDHAASAEIADAIRAHLSDETARGSHEAPERPAIARPVVAEPAPAPAGKSGKRKAIFFGAIAVLALAATSYGVHWLLVGRFHVSTDDAYVRANKPVLLAERRRFPQAATPLPEARRT